MKILRVFVLVKWGRINDETPNMEVVGVYSTKTAAKERMSDEKEYIRNFFGEEYEGESTEEYGECNESWGIQLEDSLVFQELLITEKVVDSEDL